MKKLGKLQINPEKVMKNEELVALRGGYGGWCGYALVICDQSTWACGPACGPTQAWVEQQLEIMYHTYCEGDYWQVTADYITC
jgi:hypothetical protein